MNESIKVGEVAALFRYPVKSMSGEPLDAADLGWHGIDGDRRLALRCAGDRCGFPWLSASRLPELILFAPRRRERALNGNLPDYVRTPDGEELALFGRELATDISRRHGSPVEMMHLNRGIFDEASISVIASATVDEIGRLAVVRPDVRRFRPNILIASTRSVPFEEDEWVGGVLSFGNDNEPAAICVTNRDDRCSMVNFDPDTAHPSAAVLKAIVRVRGNKAGVYGTVTRRGQLAVGQSVLFTPAVEHRRARESTVQSR